MKCFETMEGDVVIIIGKDSCLGGVRCRSI